MPELPVSEPPQHLQRLGDRGAGLEGQCIGYFRSLEPVGAGHDCGAPRALAHAGLSLERVTTHFVIGIVRCRSPR